MNTSELKRTKISIIYGAASGSGMKYDVKGGTGTKHPITGEEVPPHHALIDAIGHLARISVVFGFEAHALEVFTRERDEILGRRKQEAVK